VSLQGPVFCQEGNVEEVILSTEVSERDAQVRRVVVPLQTEAARVVARRRIRTHGFG
jgi:hypothetical protein